MGKTAKRLVVSLLLFFTFFAPSFLLTAQEEKKDEGKKEEGNMTPVPAETPAAAPPAPAEPPKPLRTNLFFRYGKLLAAEASSEKPAISDPTRQMRLARGSVYAQLVFRADRGRSISIHDFVLTDEGGKEYKCIAIAEGKDPYSGLNWIFRDTNGTTLYRMLFALPSAQGKFQLVFKHLSSDPKMPPFLLREKETFSTSFPEKGLLLLPKPPPPPPPPAPPAEEKKEEGKEGKEGNKKEEENKAP